MTDKKSPVRTYCRRVSAKLRCSRATRQRLLAGVRSEIAEALPEEAAYAEIVAAYGTPKELSAKLQETIGDDEYRRACRSRMLVAIACIVLVTSIVLVAALEFASYMKHFTPDLIINASDLEPGVPIKPSLIQQLFGFYD